MAPPPRRVDSVNGLSVKSKALRASSNMATKLTWPPFTNGVDGVSAPTSRSSRLMSNTSDTSTDCKREERVEVFDWVIDTVNASEKPEMSIGSTK
eukprot:5822775-Amphidinium_carterae.1